MASRDAERIEAAAARIGALPVVFDSADLDAVDGVVDAVERELGPIDVYVANTGGPPTGDDPLGFSRAEWEAAYRTLVLSPMAFVSRLLPAMRERGWGRVVGVSSSTVREPLPHNQLSNAHRPGLVSAFKILARQVGGGRRDPQQRAAGADRDRPAVRQRGLARGGRGRGARDGAGRPGGDGRGDRRRGRVPVLRAGVVHHRDDAARRRRAAAHPSELGTSGTPRRWLAAAGVRRRRGRARGDLLEQPLGDDGVGDPGAARGCGGRGDGDRGRSPARARGLGAGGVRRGVALVGEEGLRAVGGPAEFRGCRGRLAALQRARRARELSVVRRCGVEMGRVTSGGPSVRGFPR